MSETVSENINIHFDSVKRLEAINNLDLCPLSDRETNSFYGKSDGCLQGDAYLCRCSHNNNRSKRIHYKRIGFGFSFLVLFFT